MSGAQRDIGRGRSGPCRCRRPEGARGDRQRRARDSRRGGTNGERHLGGWIGGVWIRLELKGESQSGQRRGSVREDAQCVARDVVERKEERRAKPSALQRFSASDGYSGPDVTHRVASNPDARDGNLPPPTWSPFLLSDWNLVRETQSALRSALRSGVRVVSMLLRKARRASVDSPKHADTSSSVTYDHDFGRSPKFGGRRASWSEHGGRPGGCNLRGAVQVGDGAEGDREQGAD